MFKIPTVSKFNSWTRAEQAMWIDYETEGHIEPNTAGYLIYEKDDCFIEYVRDGSGKLKSAFAISIKEGMQKLVMFALAHGIMNNKN